jgi:hypothetical protein
MAPIFNKSFFASFSWSFQIRQELQNAKIFEKETQKKIKSFDSKNQNS